MGQMCHEWGWYYMIYHENKCYSWYNQRYAKITDFWGGYWNPKMVASRFQDHGMIPTQKGPTYATLMIPSQKEPKHTIYMNLLKMGQN